MLKSRTTLGIEFNRAAGHQPSPYPSALWALYISKRDQAQASPASIPWPLHLRYRKLCVPYARKDREVVMERMKKNHTLFWAFPR